MLNKLVKRIYFPWEKKRFFFQNIESWTSLALKRLPCYLFAHGRPVESAVLWDRTVRPRIDCE